jgi:hypothetical protein
MPSHGTLTPQNGEILNCILRTTQVNTMILKLFVRSRVGACADAVWLRDVTGAVAGRRARR